MNAYDFNSIAVARRFDDHFSRNAFPHFVFAQDIKPEEMFDSDTRAAELTLETVIDDRKIIS